MAITTITVVFQHSDVLAFKTLENTFVVSVNYLAFFGNFTVKHMVAAKLSILVGHDFHQLSLTWEFGIGSRIAVSLGGSFEE